MKTTSNVEDIREYKNLRNRVNTMIAKEKFKRKQSNYQGEGIKSTDKWKFLKTQTGQNKFQAPKTIIEGKNHIIGHKQMASSLNRQYLQNIRKLIQEMESSQVDPLENFRKLVKSEISTFMFQTINMTQFRQIFQRMKATNLCCEDDISMCILKNAKSQLEMILLHLVNTTIKTTMYPDKLKTTKIIPIPKQGKPKTTSDGWHPVNIVAALSKIVEGVLLQQILNHLNENQLIGHQHHGSVKHKSTQTLVT